MFVHLVSNASIDTFPDNKLSDFTTVLSEPLSFTDGEYEVGLSEMHIPCSINMLDKQNAWFVYLDYWIEPDVVDTHMLQRTVKYDKIPKEYKSSVVRKKINYEARSMDGVILKIEKPESCGLPQWILGNNNRVIYGVDTEAKVEGNINVYWQLYEEKKLQIREGFYKETSDLLEAINEKAKGIFKLTQNEENKRVVCTSTKKDKHPIAVRFSDQLTNILGFRKESIQLFKEKETVTARHDIDRFPGTNLFLVSTDFIEDSHVGDAHVPLLRALPFNEVRPYEIMSYQCFPVQYKKVLLREVSSIRVLITDDSGRTIPFQNRGRVYLTLHFRRRRQDYYYYL